MELFADGGITSEIRRAFVVYLASHDRTLHEVLFPRPKDIAGSLIVAALGYMRKHAANAETTPLGNPEEFQFDLNCARSRRSGGVVPHGCPVSTD